MRRILTALIAAIPIGGPVFSGAAFAEAQCSALLNQGCACAVPLESLREGVFGQLNPIVGDVLLTKVSGSHAATSVENVSVGDGIVVLENGNASLNAGPSCTLQLPAQSSLVIRAVEDCACASLVETQRVAQSQNPSGGGGRGGAALAAAAAIGVVGAGAAYLIYESDDGNPVSP